MTFIKNTFSTLLFVSVLSSCIAQSKIVLPSRDAILESMTENHVPAVGVSVIENNKLSDVLMFGNISTQSPAPVNTIFNIASLTKPIVSMLTLRLVSDGKWNLDEPLSNYWVDPDVAGDPRHKLITTRHVLSHQSGLPNWKGHEPGGKLSFAFEPGTQWKYSGEGFEYLRQALEHKLNTPIEVLADSLIFKPFGMNDTRFYWDRTMDSTRFAHRYHADGTPFEWETWTTANPSNLLLTTVGDYGKFGIEVIKGTGLSKSMREEMIKVQARPNSDREFGLGWSLVKGLSNGEYAVMHTGRNPGINTIIILLPKSKRGIIVFTNGEQGDVVYKKIISEAFSTGKEIIEQMK